MTDKEISTIICTHNRDNLLSRAIESLIHQTMDKSRYEIIVVDNASTDRTRQVCESYAGIDNFRYIYEGKAGLSIARNLGLAEAKGRYVAFLDDDAVASGEWLERIVNTFETAIPEPASVGGNILPIWEVPIPEWFPDNRKSFLGLLDYGEKTITLKYPRVLFGTNMAFLKDTLLGAGGFRTDLGREKKYLLSGEEVDVFRTFQEIKLPVLYHPDITVSHLIPKERLTKKWLYRRLYWQGRSNVKMWSGQSWGDILKEVGISLQKIGRKLIKLYRMRNEPGSAASKVSHISSLYCEVGRIQQLLVALKNTPIFEYEKVGRITQEKFTFVEIKNGWHPYGMVEISSSQERTFGGGSVKVTGAGRPGDQSFAVSDTFEIFPGKHYRVTGSMRIDSISENTSYFKCNLYQRGRWLRKIESSRYDLSRKGQWQELTAEFVSPKGKAAAVRVAIGKRPIAKEVRATIYVNGVKLEIIE